MAVLRVKRNNWLQTWARLGFAAGGIVYITIGIVALLVAIENRGRTVGPEGSIQRIAMQPFGSFLLTVVMIGLFGYAAWCFVQAFFDTDGDGNDVKGIAIRIGEFVSGLGYCLLGVVAIHRMFGKYRPSDGTPHWTAALMKHQWGVWVVGLIGVVLLFVGIGQVFYAAREGFRKHLTFAGTSASDRHWVIQLGKWGYSAQGIVLSMIGAFLITAAFHSDAHRARGLDGALQSLAQHAYGSWILAVVSAGLACYGLFMLVETKYRSLA